MFKLLTIGALIYLLYRLVFPQKAINAPDENVKINKKNEDPQNFDDGEFVDYEEID
jgi:hypothetical protein